MKRNGAEAPFLFFYPPLHLQPAWHGTLPVGAEKVNWPKAKRGWPGPCPHRPSSLKGPAHAGQNTPQRASLLPLPPGVVARRSRDGEGFHVALSRIGRYPPSQSSPCGRIQPVARVAIIDCFPLWLKTCPRHVFFTRRAPGGRAKGFPATLLVVGAIPSPSFTTPFSYDKINLPNPTRRS